VPVQLLVSNLEFLSKEMLLKNQKMKDVSPLTPKQKMMQAKLKCIENICVFTPLLIKKRN
jgi:hypothetical protein